MSVLLPTAGCQGSGQRPQKLEVRKFAEVTNGLRRDATIHDTLERTGQESLRQSVESAEKMVGLWPRFGSTDQVWRLHNFLCSQ